MTRYAKVEGFSDLVKDTQTNTILNLNREEIELARQRKLANQKKKQETENLKETVNGLKTEVEEIKQMLMLIVNKQTDINKNQIKT